MLSEGYGIMPNKVLYADDINAQSKLVYVLISSLCAERGYCRATNQYIAEKFGITDRCAKEHIQHLKEKGYIICEMSDGGTKRLIKLVGGNESSLEGGNNFPYRGEQIFPHNIISNNNTIDKKEIKEKFDVLWKQFPHARQGKKQETYDNFLKQDADYVLFRMNHLKRLIKAGVKDPNYIQAIQRRVRDLTPLSEEILNVELKQIVKRHLQTEGAKERYPLLAELYGADKIKTITKVLSPTLDLNRPLDVQI